MYYGNTFEEERAATKAAKDRKRKLRTRRSILGVVAVFALILIIASVTIIGPTQRGVKITFGKAGDEILQPGMIFKAPFVQTVKTYDLTPKSLEMKFSIGEDAAVTSDMQSVACNLVVYWTYDEARILDIVNGYSDTSIKNLVRDNTLGAIKEVIGKYSIYDIVESQEEVTEKVRTSLVSRLSTYPVTISSVTINNWDWAAAFDEQIANTMAMTQQVKIAQQELEVTKQQSQKQVAEATAAKEKAEIEAQMKVVVAEQEALAAAAEARGVADAAKIKAEGEAAAIITKAEGEAEAKKLEGEALAAYYKGLTAYTNIIETMRNLDIEEVRAEQWNGVEVSTYLPMTANGTLVSLD